MVWCNKDNKPTLVYNFEVYQKHRYFIANTNKVEMLVHNQCDIGIEMQEILPANSLKEPIINYDGRVAKSRSIGSGKVLITNKENGIQTEMKSLFSPEYAPADLTWRTQQSYSYKFTVDSTLERHLAAYSAYYNGDPVILYNTGHGGVNVPNASYSDKTGFISIKQHVDFLEQINSHSPVCLFTCHAASSGFAQNFATQSGRKVIAGYGRVSRPGTTGVLASEGGWRVFSP